MSLQANFFLYRNFFRNCTSRHAGYLLCSIMWGKVCVTYLDYAIALSSFRCFGGNQWFVLFTLQDYMCHYKFRTVLFFYSEKLFVCKFQVTNTLAFVTQPVCVTKLFWFAFMFFFVPHFVQLSGNLFRHPSQNSII